MLAKLSAEARSYLKSLRRTFVAWIVGIAVASATDIGIVLPVEATTEVVAALVGGGYYAVLRLLEHRWPVVGVLLGGRGEPTYQAD